MNADCQVTAVPLGEFRMGVDGFGASISVKGKPISCLTKEIVFVKLGTATSSNWHEEFVELSADGRFLIIHGQFATFVIDIPSLTLSLFKDTIRSADGIWCEEISIYGKDTCHVNGTRRHYYLQFPFLDEFDFTARRSDYRELRLRQIREAKDNKFG
jgi:hypothetical protein